LFEVKAPGSLLDRQHELIISLAAPLSKETPAATSTTQKRTSAAAAGVEWRSSVKKVEVMSTPSSASASAAKGKGKAVSTQCEDLKGLGGDGDGDSASTVFYSDQGESGAAASASEGEGKTTTKAGVMNSVSHCSIRDESVKSFGI
jgi:hypothetical protein